MRYLVLFALIAIGINANAQSFTLSSKNIHVEGPNASGLDALATITNISTITGDTAFNWTILDISNPMAWFVSMCDPKDCYSTLNVGLSKTFYLRKDGSGPLKTTFDFQNVNGNGHLTLLVSSVKNPSSHDTIFFSGSAWLTGVKDVSKSKSITCYPNPVVDNLNISFPMSDGTQIEIYNILGSNVKTFTPHTNTSSVYVGDLEKGIYFIRIKDKNQLFTKSFTKTEQ